MLISSLIPLILWKMTPAAWHPYLQVLAALMVLGVLVVLWRYIARDREVIANRPSRSEYRWLAGWDVIRYSRSLLTYLKVHGWRVMAASAVGPDRLMLCLKQDRHRLTVLCLRPGLVADAQDLKYLRTTQRAQATLETVLISDRPLRQEPQAEGDGVQLLTLDFDGIPELFETLEGGSEAARREEAERAAAVAAAPRTV